MPEELVRPHVLLFICDQMQYQRQGRVDLFAYTPNLDRLANDGTFFQHVYASNGQCVPSRVSMQTGLYPHEAGVMIIYGFHGHTAHLTTTHTTMGHVFRDAGYTTAYFGKTHFGTPLGELGYQHGTERHTKNAEGGTQRLSRTDKAIVDDALAFLDAHDPTRPLFLTISLHEPHPPFELVESFADYFPLERMPMPPSFYEDDLIDKPPFQRAHALDNRHGYQNGNAVRKELRQYYTMIAHVDHLFGVVRAALEGKGMWDGCVAAFTSDHGDMMGAHRMRLKGTLPYEEIFRIPFILKLPLGDAGPVRDTVDDLGVNVALPGTLTEATGLSLPSQLPGGSLMPAMRRSSRPANEEVYFEHFGAYWGLHPFRAIRIRDAVLGEWKFVKYYGLDNGEAELYDLANDPHEIHNRANEPDLTHLRTDLETRLDAWWIDTGGRDFSYYESPEFKQSGATTLVVR